MIEALGYENIVAFVTVLAIGYPILGFVIWRDW